MNRSTKITLTLLGIVASMGLWSLIALPKRQEPETASIALKLEPVFVEGPLLTTNSVPAIKVGHCGNEIDDLQKSGCPITDTRLLWEEITKRDTDH